MGQMDDAKWAEKEKGARECTASVRRVRGREADKDDIFFFEFLDHFGEFCEAKLSPCRDPLVPTVSKCQNGAICEVDTVGKRLVIFRGREGARKPKLNPRVF